MAHGFNMFGWYIGEVPNVAARSVGTPPENTSIHENPGEMRSNWTGSKWVELPYLHSDEDAIINKQKAREELKVAEKQRIQAIRKTALTDPLVNQLRGMTETEIDAWCDANITTVNDLKMLIKKIIRILVVMNEGK